MKKKIVSTFCASIFSFASLALLSGCDCTNSLMTPLRSSYSDDAYLSCKGIAYELQKADTYSLDAKRRASRPDLFSEYRYCRSDVKRDAMQNMMIMEDRVKYLCGMAKLGECPVVDKCKPVKRPPLEPQNNNKNRPPCRLFK